MLEQLEKMLHDEHKLETLWYTFSILINTPNLSIKYK